MSLAQLVSVLGVIILVVKLHEIEKLILQSCSG